MLGHTQAMQVVSLGEYSIINLLKDKSPLKGWKANQDSITTTLTKSEAYGLVCGVGGVEAIDVDLKNLSSTPKNPTANDLINMSIYWGVLKKALEQSIEDFQEKVMMVKTINNGYHIIYRAENVEGNQKLAKLPTNEVLIETRGAGGYVVMYDRFVLRDYTALSIISNADRNALLETCRSFDESPVKEEYIPKGIKRVVTEGEVLPIDDYKARASTLDVLNANGWEILETASDGSTNVLRPNNPTSKRSGNVFADGNLYVFSTSTAFEEETPYNVFDVYRILEHNGDTEGAIKGIVAQGYGVKAKQVEAPVTLVENKAVLDTEFPIDIFPDTIKEYILKHNEASGHNIDFMSGALLWVISTILGNTRQIQASTTWREYATIWLFAVGEKGFGKSAPLKAMVGSLLKISAYKSMDFMENEIVVEAEAKAKVAEAMRTEPIRNLKTVLTNTTMEGLAKTLNSSKLGVGIFRDEISSWVLDMGVYKGGGGSDKGNYLEAYDGATMDVTRSGASNIIVPNSTISVLGGIQPDIFEKIRTADNESSGFTDRILFLYPEAKRPPRNDIEMSQGLLDWYDTFINNFYDGVMRDVERDDKGIIIPKVSHFTPEAKTEWRIIKESFEDRIDSDNIATHLKGYIAKSKGRVLRYALIINTIDSMTESDVDVNIITLESLRKAVKLSDYFERMNEKTIDEANARDSGDWKISLSKTPKENYLSLIRKNPKITQKASAEKLKVSARTIGNYRKELKAEGKIK